MRNSKVISYLMVEDRNFLLKIRKMIKDVVSYHPYSTLYELLAKKIIIK
jgi:hypothetical protein